MEPKAKRLWDKSISEITLHDKAVIIGVAFMAISIIIFFLFFLKPTPTPIGISSDVNTAKPVAPQNSISNTNTANVFPLLFSNNIGDNTVSWIVGIALIVNIFIAVSMRRSTGIISMILFSVIILVMFPNIPLSMKVAVMGAPIFMIWFKMSKLF